VLSAQVAEVVLSECFHYSPEVLKGHLLPREAVHATVALPILVVLVLYQGKGIINEKPENGLYLSFLW